MTSTKRPLAMHRTVVNGLSLAFHPVLVSQLEALVEAGGAAREPCDGPSCEAVLQAVSDLIFRRIPRNPDHDFYRWRASSGRTTSQWRRAGFLKRYHLFFWHDADQRSVAYAWLYCDHPEPWSERADYFDIFSRMVLSGSPPADWADLARRKRSLAK